jgi:hypothetical protein
MARCRGGRPRATQSYDIRVTCRYAFALAVGGDDSTDLLSILPVLLGPRFTIAAGAVMLVATEAFRAGLVQAIDAWKDRNNPLQTKGMYIFSVAIFSNLGAAGNDGNTRLPILGSKICGCHCARSLDLEPANVLHSHVSYSCAGDRRAGVRWLRRWWITGRRAADRSDDPGCRYECWRA